METALNITCAVVFCGGAIWLWHLAHGRFHARLMIVALWLVLLAMAMIAGEPYYQMMGTATVFMGLIIWMFGLP